MNNIVLSFLLLLFISCKTSSQHDVISLTLQESFIAKNEAQFLEQFPKNFDQFHGYFGWNQVNDEPEELYSESNAYIDYWFELVSKDQYKKYEKSIVGISANGKWEADAVNYFQDKSLEFIKEKRKYYLINDLDNTKAKSVLFFLFDSPHPVLDADFTSNLNTSKKKIVDELFKTKLAQEDVEITNKELVFYLRNDSYFAKEIDVNNDEELDMVVSNKPYEGDELIIFLKKNDSYELALKTINFSEDGGNQIKDITQDKNGFVVLTSFPDRGLFESHFYISFVKDHWELKNTIYKTASGVDENSFVYICDVKQGIDISDTQLLDKMHTIPDEADREKSCKKVKR